MPSTPKPVVDPRFGPAWTPIIQGLLANKQQAAALNSGATQGNLLDQWGNTIQLSGSNLRQVVTIGASHGVAGVLVSTGLPVGTAGLAVQSGPAITTITLTAGSTAATVGTVTGASLSVGQVIGAADVGDPSSGIATPAITPGTTISAVSGSSVTLSQGAAESGTALYCAAAAFILQGDSGWEALTLASGVAAGGSTTPAARLQGDVVSLCGAVQNNNGGPVDVFATIPAALRPTARRDMPYGAATVPASNLFIKTDGTINLLASPSGTVLGLDGVCYRLSG